MKIADYSATTNQPRADVNEQSTLGSPESRRVKLLVSAQTVAEAKQIAHLPIDVLDFKDTSKGPLGRFASEVTPHIRSFSDQGIAVSVALGELKEDHWKRELPEGVRYAKAGPSGIREERELRDRLAEFTSETKVRSTPVAVAYADSRNANSLPAAQILDVASSLGMEVFLIDTFTKDGSCVFDFLSVSELSEITSACRKRSMHFALAGSLRKEHRDLLHEVAPSFVGLRGAVCETSRDSKIAPHKVAEWCEHLGAR